MKYMWQFASKHRVFKDVHLQTKFETDGFVIVPFYTAPQIQALTSLYHTLHTKAETGFYPSTFSKDKHYRNLVDNEIKKAGSAKINELFLDVKIVCGSFLVKYPGPNSEMNIHQDMTLVDESRFTGINIWCSLIDLTPQNGALHVLKGSHQIIPTLRGSSIPDIYSDDKVKEAIRNFSQPLYLKAGEAIIFDQSIIHFSPPNLSSQLRIVTNTFVTQTEATFIIAYWDKETNGNNIEIFEEPDDFMINYEQFGEDIAAKPRYGKSIKLVPYHFPSLTVAQLNMRYGKPGMGKITYLHNWFHKISSYASTYFRR